LQASPLRGARSARDQSGDKSRALQRLRRAGVSKVHSRLKPAVSQAGRLPKPAASPVIHFLLKKFAFLEMNPCHFAGTSGSKKIADTGQTGSQAPQSVHVAGSMYICSSLGPPWIQSTGQTSTQASSLAPIQGSVMTKAKLLAPPDSPAYFL
jgi:hypothetical protein